MLQDKLSSRATLLCITIFAFLVTGCTLAKPSGTEPTVTESSLVTTTSTVPFPSIVEPLSTPTLTVVPNLTAVSRLTKTLVSKENARQLYWSNQERAFIFNTWSSEQLMAFDPEAKDTRPDGIVERQAQIDEFMRRRLQVLEDAPYKVSPDGLNLLYHRQDVNGQGVELWFANLDNNEAQFVLTTTMEFDALSRFEDIIWCNDGREALLTRTRGESLQIWRFDATSGKIADWYKSFDSPSQEILNHIAPTFIMLSPDGYRVAFVAWSQAPEHDRLWIVDLITNHIELVGPAFAGTFPLWSPDNRYIYLINGDKPHYFGAFDASNPVGVSRFDTQSLQTVRLIQPGQLGSPDFKMWAISSDERYMLYSVHGRIPAENGMWLVDFHK